MTARSFPATVPHKAPHTYTSVDEVLLHAREHARNRLLHGCEAISWVGRLAVQHRKRHTPVFSIGAAAVQDAKAGKGEQAAHLLAGQIYIDGHWPWALAKGEAMKVAWLTRFMLTAAVPDCFNTADSAAEKAGLKDAFRRACEQAWTEAAAGGRDLTPTFARFLENADRAFRRAEADKAKRSDRATLAKASDDRLLESVILRQYQLHGVTAREANRRFPLVGRAAADDASSRPPTLPP